MKKTIFTFSILLLVSSVAHAKSGYLRAFKKTYPNSSLTSCTVCHTNGYELNSYGSDFNTKDQDFKAIETLDSDSDGVDNITEINNGTLPGSASEEARAQLERLSDEELEEIIMSFRTR